MPQALLSGPLQRSMELTRKRLASGMAAAVMVTFGCTGQEAELTSNDEAIAAIEAMRQELVELAGPKTIAVAPYQPLQLGEVVVVVECSGEPEILPHYEDALGRFPEFDVTETRKDAQYSKTVDWTREYSFKGGLDIKLGEAALKTAFAMKDMSSRARLGGQHAQPNHAWRSASTWCRSGLCELASGQTSSGLT
jgi:hypothetical protein